MKKEKNKSVLTAISGGVCAPDGFSAGGFSCGITANGSVGVNGAFSKDIREDLALIKADTRCSVGAVFTTGNTCGAPVTLSKKYMQSGYARAIFCNAGIANVMQENGVKTAKEICRKLADKMQIIEEDILIASTGEIGKTFPKDKIINGLGALVDALGSAEENSLSCARAIMTTDNTPKQCAFSFELGNYTCKIGAVFKGNVRVAPNMATTLCFITTDVNITSPMLQRALTFAVKENFNLLSIDGVASPNDSVFVLANGKAGNYQISCVDTEYEKFNKALCETLSKICKQIIQDSNHKPFLCKVSGVQSKKVAYRLARDIVCFDGIKQPLFNGDLRLDSVLSYLCGIEEKLRIEKARITLCLDDKEITLAEDGIKLQISPLLKEEIISANDIKLCIYFRDGNYSATAYGCIYST